jgi:ankyrin repeat protein
MIPTEAAAALRNSRLAKYFHNQYYPLEEMTASVSEGGIFRSCIIVPLADAGHRLAVRLLLDNGADTEMTTRDYRRKALVSAASEGHEDVVRALLENGANINGVNEGNATALICASENGHLAIVKLLLERGADVGIKSANTGKQAVQRAANVEIRELIKKYQRSIG